MKSQNLEVDVILENMQFDSFTGTLKYVNKDAIQERS